MRGRTKATLAGLCLIGGGLLAWGLYIPAKAWTAQRLLEAAWQEQQNKPDQAVRPWPWADFSPAGRLSIEELGLSQIVLSGQEDALLAFGPGLLEMEREQSLMLAGHRDTHFSFLNDLEEASLLTFQRPGGEARQYRVTGIEVVDARKAKLFSDGTETLFLVTCYPFDSLDPTGPLRYVVTARPHESVDGIQ